MDCRCCHICRAWWAWFQQPAPPTSRLFAHFRLSGSDAEPRWPRLSPPTFSFKNVLQKPTGDVTDSTAMFFTLYGKQEFSDSWASCYYFLQIVMFIRIQMHLVLFTTIAICPRGALFNNFEKGQGLKPSHFHGVFICYLNKGNAKKYNCCSLLSHSLLWKFTNLSGHLLLTEANQDEVGAPGKINRWGPFKILFFYILIILIFVT